MLEMSYIIMTVDEITFLNSKLINNFKMKSKLRPQNSFFNRSY